MRAILVGTVASLLSVSYQFVDLGPAYSVKITGSEDWKYVKKYQRDPIFVEGLEFLNETELLESAGGYYGSKIQLLDVDHTHKKSSTKKDADLPEGYFGEGCTLFNGLVYQMTYREGKVFVFDPKTLKTIKEMKMPREMEEGWGLTHDEKNLWASDGTNRIFKINPYDFSVIETINVKDKHDKEVRFINELEHVGGHIYGNVLPLNIIIKIDKTTGVVEKIWSFQDLYQMQMDHNTKANV